MSRSRRIFAEEPETQKEEPIDNSQKEESINDYRDLFLPLVNENPSLEDALDQLYESLNIKNVETQRNKVIKACKKNLEKKFEKIEKIHPKITENEALIICTYTYEDSKPKLSPYKILNTNIVSNNRKNGIKNVCKYFYILLKALRRLTPFNANNKLLHRALRQKVMTDISRDNPNFIPYKKNNEKTFWTFTSTSLEPTKDFLGEDLNKNDDYKVGTIFIIHGEIIGYDISIFSQFEEEKEILMEPERKFKIEGVNEVNDVINIYCDVLKTPLVLEDIIKVENQAKIENEKNIGNSEINISKNNCSEESSEITIKIQIEQNDVNNDIYFLDNTQENDGKYYENGNYITHNHDNLSEINENNTNLVIDEKTIPFKKFFKPEKTGTYSIKLLFKNKLSNCAYMFCKCKNIIDIDFSKFNTENVTNMSYMFAYCSLKTLNLNSFKTNKVTNMTYMFYNCEFLSSLTLSSFNTQNVNNMQYMFSGCSSLTTLDLSSFNTENVIDMSCMFGGRLYSCSSLKQLNLSSFNTKKVTDMSRIFENCSSLTNLNLSSFNTENVTNMQLMFYGCKSLKQLDLSSFNTKNVYNMESMFKECSSLWALDLSSFNTQKVTKMGWMFGNCSSMTTVNLSSFNTQNVYNMESMFSGCSSISVLNLSTFNAAKAEIKNMFHECKQLKSCERSDKKINDEYNNEAKNCICF